MLSIFDRTPPTLIIIFHLCSFAPPLSPSSPTSRHHHKRSSGSSSTLIFSTTPSSPRDITIVLIMLFLNSRLHHHAYRHQQTTTFFFSKITITMVAYAPTHHHTHHLLFSTQQHAPTTMNSSSHHFTFLHNRPKTEQPQTSRSHGHLLQPFISFAFQPTSPTILSSSMPLSTIKIQPDTPRPIIHQCSPSSSSHLHLSSRHPQPLALIIKHFIFTTSVTTTCFTIVHEEEGGGNKKGGEEGGEKEKMGNMNYGGELMEEGKSSFELEKGRKVKVRKGNQLANMITDHGSSVGMG